MRFLLCSLFLVVVSGLNLRPILGVVTQPNDDVKNKTSYMAASYVKYLEAAGARVVPVRFDASTAELDILMKGLNGLLFPGGGSSLDLKSPFFIKAAYLFNAAIKLNDNGVYFPMWGTCLGFQFLNIMGAGEDESVLTGPFDSEDYPIPLNFTAAAKSSYILSTIAPDIFNALGKENITQNEHSFGVTPQAYASNPKLSSFFSVLATNYDRKGKEFVSLVEGKKYPVYATQFHPEKNNFEWGAQESVPIPHTLMAVRMSQFFADFLVDEARNNNQSFGTNENDFLIYNYAPVFTGKSGGYFTQEYYF
jgi:gamma-glutamyl hydrolase